MLHIINGQILLDLGSLCRLLVRDARMLKLSGDGLLFRRFCRSSGLATARGETGARGECFHDRDENRLLSRCFDSDLLCQVPSVFCLALDVGFGAEDRQRVVKAVKLHKLSDHLGGKRRLTVLSQFAGEWVLLVERALTLLNLVLVVDCLKNTGAKLCAHLPYYAVRLKRLNNKIF
jgi:hypothetical protein